MEVLLFSYAEQVISASVAEALLIAAPFLAGKSVFNYITLYFLWCRVICTIVASDGIGVRCEV